MNCRLHMSIAFLLCLGSTQMMALEVNSLFSDHAVLQQGKPLPVWGTGGAGEEVTVSLAGKSATAKADAKGVWQATLPAMKAGGPHELVIKGTVTLTIKDVMVGEVWLFSGQSNMSFKLSMLGYKPDPASENQPLLRMLTVPKTVAQKPETALKVTWQVTKPGKIAGWGGLPYYFGSLLQKKLGVAVGIINSSVGGTPIESWMSDEALKSVDSKAVQDFRNWVLHCAKNYKALKAKHPKNKGIIAPDSPWRVNGLYNGMIHPLAPFAIAGMTWYQGESNASRPVSYAKELPLLIKDWRKLWGEVPFLVVQLAGYGKGKTWAVVRDSQMSALALPRTGIAVAADIGHATNIHPPAPQKKALADRLTLLARKIVYGEKDLVAEGPRVRKVTIDGKAVRIQFSSVGAGLEAKGGTLKGFAMAGKDKSFKPASAIIDGDTVVVQSEEVAQPVAVRYAWKGLPECTLYNKEGLPAPPFRTDTWTLPGK